MTVSDKDILKPLIDRLLEFASHPDMDLRKKLWADHQALHKTEKIPVCVWYEFIPEPQWKHMLGEFYLECLSDLGRYIEADLKKRLWMAEHVPDDHILWPTVSIPVLMSREVSWGVSYGLRGTNEALDDPLEAKKIIPAFPEGIEPDRVRFTDMEVDAKATSRLEEQARELTGDRLTVVKSYADLGCSPFDLAVKMRGLENIMYDLVDAPDQVQQLMERITAAFEQHHRNREKRGWLNVAPSLDGRYMQVGFRVHCAYIPSDFDPEHPRLRDEWAYISAQTSSGLSPTMYEEFVHPYNTRLAAYFSQNTVYYHGCERLDHKLDILATLPNLRRFHVSPWSSVEKARHKFGGKVVLEVHSHPGLVFFSFTRADMKAEIRRLVEAAEGVSMDLNLSDIHSVNGNPKLLQEWAAVAQKIDANP